MAGDAKSYRTTQDGKVEQLRDGEWHRVDQKFGALPNAERVNQKPLPGEYIPGPKAPPGETFYRFGYKTLHFGWPEPLPQNLRQYFWWAWGHDVWFGWVPIAKSCIFFTVAANLAVWRYLGLW